MSDCHICGNALLTGQKRCNFCGAFALKPVLTSTPSEFRIEEGEARRIMHALDLARDAIQPLTVAQIKLHNIPNNLDQILEEAMDILGPKLGMTKKSL